ncbi:MAG: hypothetical protein QF733_02280 [Phycisphaerales bacterium]|jgi:hypothetical protein|nr:hypothetical protein [Phycisphaerales bacterium]
MSIEIAPNQTLTFTVKAVPPTASKVKTIERLMWMQPTIQKGMRDLQRRRRQTDNHTYIRAGRPWTNRKRATRLQRCEAGQEFTLAVTPQIVGDLKSVATWLDVRSA